MKEPTQLLVIKEVLKETHMPIVIMDLLDLELGEMVGDLMVVA